jgi:ATP synthase protein I
VTDQPDDRSLMAVAMTWTSLVTSVALEMALPPLVGHWIDEWLGIGPWFLSLGALFGLAAGLWHLLRVTAKPNLLRSDSDGVPDRRGTPRSDGEDENS